MTETKPPKVFISYAWEDDLKTWVLDFAKRLRLDGVNAILDQWETVPGDQLPEFMEKSVRESDFVVFVCTPTYKRKSDRRKGGVGYEGHIITGEVFQKNNHRKFIPVLRKGKWGSAAPSWATSKLFIDFRGDPYSEVCYQQLLNTLFGKSPTAPPLRDDTLREKLEREVAEKITQEKEKLEEAKKVVREKAQEKIKKRRLPYYETLPLKKTTYEELKPEKSPHKLNTAIIVAIIGAIATIIAGLLSSPLMEKLSPVVPMISATATFQTVFTSELPSGTEPLTIPSPTPLPSIEYTVRDGDSCQTISVAFQVSIRDIYKLNGSSSFCEQLFAGDVIMIPAYAINMPLTPTVSPTKTKVIIPTATPLPTEITDDKGVSMVLVPAGEFLMGSDTGAEDEKPVHKVYLDTYYIDKYEVTNLLYSTCVASNICVAPGNTNSYSRTSYYGNSEFNNYPVMYLDWSMAKTYCEWRGARLPTEAEWEKAARGTDGRTYPWGEGIDCNKANYGVCVGDTTIIGKYESGKSPYGAYDMAGNIAEWVSSLYKSYPYSKSDGRENLLTTDGERVYRGAFWIDSADLLRVSARKELPIGLLQHFENGVRCARDANP